MKQQNKEKQHLNLQERIRKQIERETINNVTISYSYLNKKNNSGITTNSRLFFLFHQQQVGYINQLPKGQYLPFFPNLPNLKAKIKLEEIEKISCEKQMLKILFNKNNKKNIWEFKCVNYDQARQWAKLIQESKKKMIESNNSNPQSKEKNKKSERDKLKISSEFNSALNKEHEKELNTESKMGMGNDDNNNLGQKQTEKNQKKEREQQGNERQKRSESEKKILQEKRIKQEKRLKQQKNQKLKEDYKSKIKEQKKTEQKMKLKSQIPKQRIQDMQREWSYQFAKSHNEFEIIENFKKYVETITSIIIDEFGLKEKRREYHPKNATSSTYQYEINGVLFTVFLIQLSQNNFSYKFTDQQTVVSNQQAKQAEHQFKNYNYILSLTENKGKIRVPLSMITHYKGFTVFAKVLIPTSENYNNLPDKQLQLLQTQTRIHSTIFYKNQQPHSRNIIPLENKLFEKLSRAENLYKKFDLWYIQNLKYYLPYDCNNFRKEKNQNRFRKQLIQDDECQNLILYGDEDMCSIIDSPRSPQHLFDHINNLKCISKLLLGRVENLVDELQNADEYFINSEELSSIMHCRGINMRYLGTLYKKLQSDWLKKIILSEICARCIKKQLNFQLEDCILNLAEQCRDNETEPQKKLVAEFLNKMLGKKQQTEALWKKLVSQARFEFQVEVNKEQVNKQYLLQAIQHHCCIKIRNLYHNLSFVKEENSQLHKSGSKLIGSSIYQITSKIKANCIENQQQLFDYPKPFSANDIEFEIKSKVYDLSFTELYAQINSKLEDYTSESFEQLMMILNLQRVQSLPSHFKMSQMYEKILSYVINWISPQQMPKLYELIEREESLPSRLLYRVKLAKIRWTLKGGDVKKSEICKDELINHLNRWIGDCHPILTELYEIYANYYEQFKNQQTEAIKYCKNAIANQKKVLGANHNKIANSYYLFGTVWRSFGKKESAIHNLEEAQKIIEKNNNKESQAYGKVCLEIGQLYLSVDNVEKAEELAGTAMAIILEKWENHLDYIESIELVCRCFEVRNDWESYKQLVCNTIVHQVGQFIDEVELIERIIKICILPSLVEVGDRAQQILKIISCLYDTSRTPNMAYNFLKDRIQEKVFPHHFLQSLNNIDDILNEIEVNGVLIRWKGFQSLAGKSSLSRVGSNSINKGFDFIATLEALNIFLGGFIEGVLYDQ